MKINIAKDFSESLGGRYVRFGPNSGEEFLNSILLPKYRECQEKNEKLTINLDGTFGYATSFLEESFGGLVRETKDKNVFDNLNLISDENAEYVKLIKKYIKDAEKELK